MVEFKVTKHSEPTLTAFPLVTKTDKGVPMRDSVAKLAETARRANITRQHNLKLQGFIVDDDVSD